MSSVELIVFDMVGTTVADEGQVLTAFVGALREQGIRVTDTDLGAWRGARKREVLRHFIERNYGRADSDNVGRVERATADFRERLESDYLHNGVRVIPGVGNTFAWLCERKIKIALTTGFYRNVTDIILRATGWLDGPVDASICSDDVPQGRPAPYMIFRAMEATGVIDVRRVFKIGDTALDLMSGRNAGLGGLVGVLSGSLGAEQLRSVPHTHIISSVADLPELLEQAAG